MGDICDTVLTADFHGDGFSALFKESNMKCALLQRHAYMCLLKAACKP